MRIAIASTYLGLIARGIESWARDLSAELHRRGCDITLFKGGGPPDLDYEVYLRCPRYDGKAAARTVWFTRHGGWRVGLGSTKSLQQVVFAWTLVGRLRRGRYDIVHVQDAWAGRVLEFASRCRLHRAKVVFMHGTEEAPEFLERFHYVQEQAPHYIEQHQKRGATQQPQWFMVPSFVDCDCYSPGDRSAARAKFGLPVDRFVVLDVAALRISHKRLDWLIREMAALKGKGVDVMLVAAGAPTPETPQVEALARELLGEDCRLLKGVARADMVDLYRAADVVANPSLREVFGLVFVEAMACGVPVIGHLFPVTKWVIGPGGEAVDMECEGALSQAVGQLKESPELKSERAAAAHRHVLEMFETRRVVDQYQAMYNRILEDN